MSDVAPLTPKAIRLDVATRLAAAGLVPAGNVLGFRTTPLPRSKMPGLLVYTSSKRSQNLSIASPYYRVILDIAIECVLDGNTDEGLGDELDDLATAVEALLLTDPAWVDQFERIGDTQIDYGSAVDGERRMALAKLTIPVQFVTQFAPRISDTPALSTVAVTVDTLPVDGSPEGHLTITLP